MINSNLKLAGNMDLLQFFVKNTEILFYAQITAFILVLLCTTYECYLWPECFEILSFIGFMALILSISADYYLSAISIQNRHLLTKTGMDSRKFDDA